MDVRTAAPPRCSESARQAPQCTATDRVARLAGGMLGVAPGSPALAGDVDAARGRHDAGSEPHDGGRAGP